MEMSTYTFNYLGDSHFSHGESQNKINSGFFLINLGGYFLLQCMFSCPSTECSQNLLIFKDYLMLGIKITLLIQFCKLIMGLLNENSLNSEIFQITDSLYLW